ncbi:hypothetical protein HA402_011351 [Bradysia odoriphaga]|nr:hypothetical protein HA402_011351 [Bradysia odoriphaga]
MFVSNFICALMVVSPSVLGITLPNGFTFDELQYLEVESRVASSVPEKCEQEHDGCSSDCSTQLFCDGFFNVTSSYLCSGFAPYCVRNGGHYAVCAGNFPMSDPACVTKATNNFICTEDGEFPDPTDCSKYHVCNGNVNYIKECGGNEHFTYDRMIVDPKLTPGNGEFRCRYRRYQEGCTCDQFYCEGKANQFIFRPNDYFHYAYCLEIGAVKKALMFKCPNGTRHERVLSPTNSVDCIPNVPAPIV